MARREPILAAVEEVVDAYKRKTWFKSDRYQRGRYMMGIHMLRALTRIPQKDLENYIKHCYETGERPNPIAWHQAQSKP